MSRRSRAMANGFSRRQFLGAAGATALSAPFLRSLPSFAAGEDRRYLVLLFSPNGVVRHLWGGTPGPTGMPGDFTLRPWLAPLAPYKDKMIIVRGLANKAAGQGDPHGPGMASLWTGVPTANQELASGPSIDQVIAQTLKPATPHTSLEFRARSPEDYEGKSVHNRMIYSASGAPKDPRDNALTARDQLFLGIGSGPATPTVDPRIEIRRQLFGRLDGELSRLAPRLCTDDKRHLEALRDGWTTLSGRLGSSGGGALANCKYPDTITGGKGFPMITHETIDLLVMALACDLTRFASLQFSQALSPMVPSWLGITLDHHNVSHAAPQRYALGPMAPIMSDADNPLASQVTNNMAIDQMTKINEFYAQEVAYLCQRLSQFPVDGGKTLLDQCIIVWGNELDNGSGHDHWDMPFTIIGGGGGRLKTNQLVQLPVYNGYGKMPKDIVTAARSHNDLLVTLAQAMGATGITSFGAPSINHGAITQMLAV